MMWGMSRTKALSCLNSRIMKLDGTIEPVTPWVEHRRMRSSLHKLGKKRGIEFCVVRHLNATWGSQKKTRWNSLKTGFLVQVGWQLSLEETYIKNL